MTADISLFDVFCSNSLTTWVIPDVLVLTVASPPRRQYLSDGWLCRSPQKSHGFPVDVPGKKKNIEMLQQIRETWRNKFDSFHKWYKLGKMEDSWTFRIHHAWRSTWENILSINLSWGVQTFVAFPRCRQGRFPAVTMCLNEPKP